jgi:hypothetical protein
MGHRDQIKGLFKEITENYLKEHSRAGDTGTEATTRMNAAIAFYSRRVYWQRQLLTEGARRCFGIFQHGLQEAQKRIAETLTIEPKNLLDRQHTLIFCRSKATVFVTRTYFDCHAWL